MPSIEAEFEVYCSICGEGLCNMTSTSFKRGKNIIEVGCEKCKEKSFDEGYEKGYNKGYDEGYNEAMK